MEIEYSKNNTHIKDSYRVQNKKSMENIIVWIIQARSIRKLPITRSEKSYLREWIGHNRLYQWHIAKTHIKDLDLNENNTIFEELLWMIIGR